MATMEPLHRSARLVIQAGRTLNRVGRRGKFLGSHRFNESCDCHTIRDRKTGKRIIVVAQDGPNKGLYEFA